eukprot:TRINITY_DN11974_c0_g1_i2.p1 TRINITY_DN11974_c0_g1~~TRINITY_DN11974_c0_g1_i2.p1  ORF type:complete len:726 (+),score=340.44 TRINITY_DN11974_c0_g1_i2:74-2179(+)
MTVAEGDGAVVARPAELLRNKDGAHASEVDAGLAHLDTAKQPAPAPQGDPNPLASRPKEPAPPPQPASTQRPPPPSAAGWQSPPRQEPPLEGARHTEMGGRPVTYHSSQQQQINFQLRTQVIDEEDALSTAHDQLITLAKERPKAMAEKHKASMDALIEHEHGMKWAAPSSYDAAQLVKQFGLQVSFETFEDLVRRQVPDTAFLPLCLTEFSRAPDLSGKLGRRRWEQRKDQLATLAPICVMGPPPMRSADLAAVATGYYEYLHSDVLGFTRQELSATDGRLSELAREVEATEAYRHRAQEDGALARCRDFHVRKAELLKEICDIYHRRVEMVMGGQDDTGSFAENLRRFQQSAHETSDEFRENKTKLMEAVTHDLKVLQQSHAEQVATHQQALDAYDKESDENFKQIKANAKQQEEVWRRIEEMMRELQRLGVARTELAKKQLEAKEREEHRRSSFRDYCEVHREHLLGMQQLRDQTAVCVNIAEETTRYISVMDSLLEDKNIHEAVALLTLEEQQKYLLHYRQFTECAGDLHARLEQRMQNIQRCIRTNEVHIELAEDAYDDNSEKYHEAKRELEAQRAACKENLDNIWDMMRQATDDFTRTDADLASAGIDFIPPMIELQGQQAKRKEKVVEKTRKFVAQEQDQVEQDQTSIRRLNMMMHQQAEVARARPVTREFKRRPGSPSPDRDKAITDALAAAT